MSLSARVSKLEFMQDGGNPLACLTDEQLEDAIAAVKARIVAATGMSEVEYANYLSQQLIVGKLSNDMDPEIARRFVTVIMSEVNGKTRTADV